MILSGTNGTAINASSGIVKQSWGNKAEAKTSTLSSDTYQSSYVKAEASRQRQHFPVMATIGTAVSAVAGGALGMFAVGMADRAVSIGEMVSVVGGGALAFGIVGAFACFGITAIVRSIRD